MDFIYIFEEKKARVKSKYSRERGIYTTSVFAPRILNTARARATPGTPGLTPPHLEPY